MNDIQIATIWGILFGKQTNSPKMATGKSSLSELDALWVSARF